MDKILSWAILGIYVGIILYALDKGFDFSDEGMYLMLADPLQPNVSGLLNYDLFFKLFYQYSGFQFGIVQIRMLRLLFYLLGAGFVFRFWSALFPEDRNNGSRTILIFPLMLISLFGGYAFLPQSLSYNSLTAVLTCFLFGIYGTGYWKGKSSFVTMLLTGTVLAFLFYIKVTVFFGFIFLIFGLEMFSKKKIIVSLFQLLFPLVLMEAVFAFTLGKSGFLSIMEGFQLSQVRGDYGLLHVLKSVLVGFFWSVLIFGSGLFGVLAFQNGDLKRLAFAFSSFSLAVFSLYWITITEESTYYLIFAILFTMGFLSMNKSTIAGNSKFNGLLLVLFFLPFVLHWGSNVYFMRIGVHYLFLWILWIMVWLRTYGEFSQIKKAVFVIGIFLLPFVLDGLWWRPFGQQSIFHQTEGFAYQENKRIFIDREQVQFLQNLDEILETLQAKNLEVLPLYGMPGPLYLLDRQIPKTPGIWNLSHFEAYFAKDLKAKVILFNGSDKLPEVVRRNYLLYEYPEKALIGNRMYVLKESQDGKGE